MRPNVRGFTLLEVVVGLILMASLLVTALHSFSAHRRQLLRAERTLLAVELSDRLLSQMAASRTGIPVAGRGAIPEYPGWIWETSVVSVAAPMRIPLRVIRLRIIDTRATETARVINFVDVVKGS